MLQTKKRKKRKRKVRRNNVRLELSKEMVTELARPTRPWHYWPVLPGVGKPVRKNQQSRPHWGDDKVGPGSEQGGYRPLYSSEG